jgi:hypothetical protein
MTVFQLIAIVCSLQVDENFAECIDTVNQCVVKIQDSNLQVADKVAMCYFDTYGRWCEDFLE